MSKSLFQRAHPAGAGPGGPAKAGFSRRVFLVRGSLAAGAAAVVGSIPNVGSLLTSAESDAPAAEGGAASAASAASAATAGAELSSSASEPIIAHVVDAGTGEINLYQGTAQVVVRNPGLAQAVARLAQAHG